MKGVTGLVIGIIALGGCTDDDNPCPGGRHAITIGGSADTAVFTMYRDGDGDWQDAIVGADGFHVACVADEYLLVNVCDEEGDRYSVDEVVGTAADGPYAPLNRPCFPAGGGTALSAHIRGSFTSSAVLSTGHDIARVGVDFNLPVAPGRNDVLASSAFPDAAGAAGTFKVFRDLDVQTDLDLGVISLDDGIAVAAPDLAIDNQLPGDALFTTTSWLPDPDKRQIALAGTHDAAPLFPTTQFLAPGEQYMLEISSLQGPRSRYVQRVLTAPGASTTIRLPDLMPEPAFSPTSVQWTDPLPAASVVVFDSSGSESYVFMDASLVVTQRWLDRHDVHEIAFDASAPGFDSRWIASTPQLQSFYIARQIGDDQWENSTFSVDYQSP